jgi:hypothetical protein
MQNTLDKSLQKEVRAHLGWSALEHAEFIEQTGIAYLQALAPDYPQVVTQITKSQIFWNWWKAHWETRDIEFIESIDYEPSPILDPVKIYKEQHDAQTLAQALYLNGQVLQESYPKMIGKLTDKQIFKHKEVAA